MKFQTAQEVYGQNGRSGMPAWTYNNAELSELEIQQIFVKSWVWVCHVSEIPNPGDYRCFDVADERALVMRDQTGQIGAFHNVCRHRGSRVVAEDRGHCDSAIVCPFHGWSYELDGRLKNIARSKTFPELDKSQMGLKPLDLEIWHGLVFVRFSGDGPSVSEIYAPAEKEIGLYRIEDMEAYGQPSQIDFDLDWKSVLEIDNEGYHVPMGHPQLFDLTGTSYQDQVLDCGLSRAYGSFENRQAKSPLVQNYLAALPEDSYLPKQQQNSWIYWGMFPGFVVTLFPDMVEIYQVYPLGYQKSVMGGACYALPDERSSMQKARTLNREINDIVSQEDMNLVKWSAEGMRSSAFENVTLSDLEIAVGSFHNQLREYVPVAELSEPPESGTLAQVNQQLLAAR